MNVLQALFMKIHVKQTSLHCVHNYGTFKGFLLKTTIMILTHKCSKHTAFDLIDSKQT